MGKVIGWIVALALVVSAAIGGMYLYSRSNGGFAYEEPAYDAATLPHIAAGQTLAFTDGQNRSALLGGWSVSEPRGVWSHGNSVYLGFIVGSGPDQASMPQALVLKVSPYLVPGKLPVQRVEVWSNGKKIGDYVLQPTDNEIAVPLNGLNLAADAPLILALHLPDARSPRDLGVSADGRLLGVKLESVQME